MAMLDLLELPRSAIAAHIALNGYEMVRSGNDLRHITYGHGVRNLSTNRVRIWRKDGILQASRTYDMCVDSPCNLAELSQAQLLAVLTFVEGRDNP